MKKILIADDEPEMVALIKTMLESRKYQVFTAFDGSEALQKARQCKPDLVLMDIMMPRMLGSDAVKILQEDPLTKQIPIIFLTIVTSELPQNVQEGEINIGGKFFPSISKPVELEKLLFRVKKLIGDV